MGPLPQAELIGGEFVAYRRLRLYPKASIRGLGNEAAQALASHPCPIGEIADRETPINDVGVHRSRARHRYAACATALMEVRQK